jgi:beta-galactosidase
MAGLILIAGGCAGTHRAEIVVSPERERTSLDDGWKFIKGDGDYAPPATNDSTWRTLDVPHDWAIEGPFVQADEGATGKRDYWGPVWYRKHFSLPASDAARRIYIDFDGAMSYAQVWVNGQKAAERPYGYASFQVDATPFIKVGQQNVVSVRLDSPKDSSRWYPGAGIERNVWLTKTNSIHVGHWGVYITTPRISETSAEVSLQTTVENQSATPVQAGVRTRLYEANADGKPIGQPVAMTKMELVNLEAGGHQIVKSVADVIKPKLWGLRSPNRYVAVTTIDANDSEVDRVETPFGIRTIAFDPANGFILNGKRVQIQGVCDHHDLGPLGAVVNIRGIERQIQLLQEMGCNAIRTSHNPPAPELLDLCDRMGMVVMDEGFDCWQIAKRPGDYHLLWDQWHETDWRQQIERDRNHPCVVLWSIGNELPEFKKSKIDGQKIAEELTHIAHEEDPTRPTTFACNDPTAGYDGYQKTVDVFGLNYRPTEYRKFVETHPEIPFIGSETSSTVSTRGVYVFPIVEDQSKGQADFQVSSYDLYAPRWASTPDAEFKALDENPSVAGEFVWTGFDYLGEPTPFNKDATNLLNFTDPAERAKMADELKNLGKIEVPSRSSYFGILDLCGFKKDRFYLYQSRWRPQLPMVHILPHWNWPDRLNQVTPVMVYTSGDEVELFLNGKSLGKKTKNRLEYRLRWNDIKYAPGELKAVAYKAGQKWAEETIKTTGPAAAVKISPDRRMLTSDGQDLSFVTISIVDKDGTPVPRANNLIHCQLTGPGEIVAMDNGDPTGHQSFQSQQCPAFNGLCLAIIRTHKNQPGEIHLKVTSDGAGADETVMEAVAKK